MSTLALAFAAAAPPEAAYAQTAPDAEAPPALPRLSLEDALARAAAAYPARAGLDARLRGVEASVRQAEVKPNPVLGLTVENLPTLGGGDILDRTETTLTYEQRLERGGDRDARSALARSEGALVLANARVAQLDRLELVQKTWAETLAAEALLDIARQRVELAEQFQAEVRRRVEAARDPLFAGARADAEAAQAQIDVDQADVAVRMARISLAMFWDARPEFSLGRDAFEDTSAARVVAGDTAEADLDVFRAKAAMAEAQVRVEEARAIPDPTVSVGVRHIWDNEVALVFGGSIPLQRHDRNRGAIERARADGLAAQADLNAYRMEREREIARLQIQLMAKASEARRISEETLPEAERAVTLVREGFNRGGFTYNDVMAAQTALLQARARRVTVLQAFHNDRARLDRLTGAHADLFGAETRQ